MSFGLAFQAFFAALFNKQAAQKIRAALSDTPSPQATLPAPVSAEAMPATKTGAGRNDALTLVSTLQREARFLDLVQEPLDEYTDAQVGAAARDVLRDSAKTLNRLFAIEKLVAIPEGERVEIPKDASAAHWRVIGSNPSAARGTLVHAGWKATHCNLPQWIGQPQDALVFAPAEVEA